VREVARTRDWNLAWDIGCNVGVFSRIVAERAKTSSPWTSITSPSTSCTSAEI
jgi:hypothetical protein